MALCPRNARYKDQILSAPYEICVERARYYTESYRATEGEPPAIRAAKALAHTLRRMTVHILDEERIVGNRAKKLVAVVIPVERGDINTLLEMEMDLLTARARKPYRIEPEERQELLEEIFPYWRGRTVHDRKKALWDEAGLFIRPSLNPFSFLLRRRGLGLRAIRRAGPLPRLRLRYAIRGIREVLYNNPAFVMNVFDLQGHLILGHRNILREGFAGVRARAEARLSQAQREGDTEGESFLRAVILCCEAIRDFAARFADLAENLATKADDPARREELRQIAARCRHVPYHPPRDFREAVQALWLTQVGALVAHGMGGIFAVGRLDQTLYPFYAADRAAGRITAEEATAWLEELLLKLSCNLLVIPTLGKATGSELGADSCAPTVGGIGRDGRDAVNELSYLFLDAFANLRGTGSSFMIRLAENSPPAFRHRAIAIHRHTSGAALFSDEAVVPALIGCGYAEEDARDYGAIGCVEPTGDGDTFGCTSGNDVSLVGALEMTLLNGSLRILGRRLGPATGDPRTFATFDEFMDAFRRQVVFMIDLIARGVNLKDRIYREEFPIPYVSATLTGCVENARDATAGGAKYNFGSIGARGMGTVTDSLAAIKHFVYDTRTLSMDRLLRLLNTNFRGEEKTRRMLATRGPKFGADDPDADRIAREVAEFFCREVASRRTIRGGPFRPGFFSYGMHVMEGWFLGATPDGRRAGEPISNSFSPANGSERKGPTAALRSVARVDHRLISNGCAVNVKLTPSLLEGDERAAKIADLVRGYFALGGMEVQFNVVSNQILREAQEHPEKYRDLVVRVSGYSAYFTDLGRPLQDEIICRTEFGNL